MRWLVLTTMLVISIVPVQTAVAQSTFSCDDFATQDAAQAVYEMNPTAYAALDPDGNGLACDSDGTDIPAGGTDLVTTPPASVALTGGTCDPEVLARADLAPASTLDGLLGGTVASFDAVYGPSTGGDLFPEYAVPGCGPVLVSDFEDNVVVDLSVFSPRDGDDQDYMQPHEADWTIAEAMAIAESFLPPDAVFEPPRGDMNPPASGMLADEIEVRGSSQMLLESVPSVAWDYVDNTPTYGGFSYWLLRTYSGNVSWIIIQLEIED